MRSYLLQPIPASWMIAVLATGILPGAYIAGYLQLPVSVIEWYVVAGVLSTFLLVRQYRFLVVAAFISGFCLGMARGAAVQQIITSYQQYSGKIVLITGKVAGDASVGIKGDERYVLQVATLDSRPITGKIWVSFGKKQHLKRGDTVTIEGQLRDGFGTNLASVYRAEIIARDTAHNTDFARALRDWFAASVHQLLPADEAGLALGFLVGQKQSLSESVAAQFQIVGLMHAVVASGFHLTVLVMFVRRVLEHISKYLTLVAALAMIVGFTAVTGLSPSMSRAAIIASLALWAWYYGRTFHPGVLLLVVAGASTLWNPLYVQGDIGWYLSFAAFVGVIMLAPLLHAYFWGEKTPGMLRTLILGTIAAQIATLPLLLYIFGTYSPYSVVANLLIVPLVTLAMAATFIVGIIGLVFMPMAYIFAIPLKWLLGYMIEVVSWLSTLPYAQQELSLSFSGMIALYAVLVGLMWYLHYRSGHSFMKQWQII